MRKEGTTSGLYAYAIFIWGSTPKKRLRLEGLKVAGGTSAEASVRRWNCVYD